MYVDYDHALHTANSVANLQTWTSETLHHDALANDTDQVLEGLGTILRETGAITQLPVDSDHTG